MSDSEENICRGFRGYVTLNSFGGYNIPAAVQNIIMRNYASNKGLNLKLSFNEHRFQNCFVQLKDLLKELPNLGGVLMCSIFMLPVDRGQRQVIYDQFLENEASLHFVLENKILRDVNDIAYVEEILAISLTLKACPTSIQAEAML
ncbi:sporadic carbohydrate cluster protein, TIGR04323 family [bacterium]|nr:sporadic carbohydrate cluster protein, TIGR04323 family [bacterium]